MTFEAIVRRVVEKLYEDERLRSNLTDVEAKIVLDWAVGWIERQVGTAGDGAHAAQLAMQAFEFARQTARAIDALAATPGSLRLADALAALDPRLNQPLPREEVLRLLCHCASALGELAMDEAPRRAANPAWLSAHRREERGA